MEMEMESRETNRGHFLPEESFQSWGNYGRALLHTPQRLGNRLMARSNAEGEQHLCLRSENQMKKTLNWWDLIWFGIGAVIGAGVFVMTGQEARNNAGPSIVLSYAAAGFSAMLSVFCYTEFAIEIPVAGGSFAYLRVEMGDFMAFIGAGNIILEYVLSGAAVARSWSAYFATLLNRPSDAFLIHTDMKEGYNLLDPIAVVVLVLIGLVAIWSTRAASVMNSVASFANMFVILFVIAAGLAHADTANISPFFPFGVHGTATAASVVYFAYIGFDAVATLAEETKNPPKDIPLGLIGSMSITTVLYCLMALTISLMQNYTEIDENAPFSLAFSAVGWDWAKYIVALGALKGMTTVILVSAIGQARYVTHIARTHMIPPWFALVNKKTGTPVNATAVMFTASAIVAFFTDLQILANLVSISTLFIFMLVATSLLLRRYYVRGQTTSTQLGCVSLFISVIFGSSVVIAAYWALSDGWIGYAILVPFWFVGTLGLQLFVPMARMPRVWGCPLIPWIPSLSIATNIFLLGSIDKDSYVRFAAWTGFLLVYYFLFGLHASYDTAMDEKKYPPVKPWEEAPAA